MIKWLTSLFSKSSPHGKTRHKLKYEPGGLAAMGDIPRYPPFHEGLPAATPQELLATQDRLIRQIRHEISLPNKDYERMIPPLLESFAAFVHLLPASKSHHHRGAGGMLRHGLEVALISTRKFHSRIIDGHETGERRKVLEPRWRLAVFVAGLTHDIGKSAYDLSVTDIDGRQTWDVYTQNLHEFLCENKLDRYYVGWRKNREHKVHEKFSHLLTMRVVPNIVFSWLNEGDPKIISAIHETISGTRPKGSARVMYDLVMEADQLSVSQDIKGQRVADGDDSLAVPVPKYLLDAIARLVDSDKWKANKPGQPLWVTNKGVFIDWKKAVPDIVRLLDSDGARGIPKSRNSIAESLADYDVIKTHEDENGDNSYYVIFAPQALEKGGVFERVLAVEVNGLDVLFDGPHPTPVPAYLGEGQIAAREEAIAKEKAKIKEERKQENKVFRDKMGKKGVELPVVDAPLADDTTAEPDAGQSGASDSATSDEPHPGTQQAAAASEEDSQPQPDPKPKPRKKKAATKTKNTASEPADDSWLSNYGEMGDILRECFIPGENSKAFMHEGDLLLPYPEGMSRYGDAKGNKLSQIQDLLYFDPMTPNKAVHKLTIKGQKRSVLMIKGELAKGLSNLSAKAPITDQPVEPPATAKVAQKPTAKKAKSRVPVDPDSSRAPTTEKVAKTTQPSSEASPKPEQKNAAGTKAKAKAKAAKKPAKSTARKTPARKKEPKDTPPPMPAGRNSAPGKKAGDVAVTQLFEKFNEVKPSIETFADDTGVWANQIQLIEWFKTDIQSSLSHSALMLGLMKSATGVKEINKETFVHIPFERDRENVEP